MMPTEKENQENKSSNNYGSMTTFFAGSLTSAALIAGTCYIKTELCISLLNTAAKESTALVTLPTNTKLTVAWDGLKDSIIKFAQDQLTPTQEQLISSAITEVTSRIIEMTSSEAWALKVDEIDKIIEGSDGYNYGPDQTLNDLDMSRIESDSSSGSGRSTHDASIKEPDDIKGDSSGEEESGTVSTRTRTASVDYQGDGSELNLENTVVDQPQGSPSGATRSGREYQVESGRDSQSNTPVNTPVKLVDTHSTDGTISDFVEKRVSFEEEHGDNTGAELQQTSVEVSGKTIPADNVDA